MSDLWELKNCFVFVWNVIQAWGSRTAERGREAEASRQWIEEGRRQIAFFEAGVSFATQ